MKRTIFIIIILLTIITTLSAQLNTPIIEFDRTWAYQFERIEIVVNVEGTSDDSSVKIELTTEEGDLDILSESKSTGYSYDYVLEEGHSFVESNFTAVTLKSERIVLKAIVTDLSNNKMLESNTVTIELIPQPGHPEAQSPNRDAVNLNLMKSEIYQGEETVLLIEAFSDDKVVNMEYIRLEDSPVEIKYIREAKEKEIYFQGLYGNLQTTPVMVYSYIPGKYTIPAQEIELEIRDSESNEIRTETLRTSTVELIVKEVPDYTEGSIIASKMDLELYNYPESLLKGEELFFQATLISNGCLDSIESLSNQFTGRIELEEKIITRVKLYDGNETLYKVIFEYSMVSKSLVGLKLPEIVIPYFNTEDGIATQFEYEFPIIDGNIDPVLFWSFILVVLGIIVLSTFFVLLYIKKNKSKRNLEKDIPIDENNMATFLVFVEEYSLTQREKDILKILVDGKSTKDIAESLFISPETAKKHINNIMKKTKTHSRYEIYVLLNKYIKQID